MKNQLKQKNFLKKTEIDLYDNKVVFKFYKGKDISETTINYEYLSKNLESYTKAKDIYLVLSIVSGIILFFSLIYIKSDSNPFFTIILFTTLTVIFGILFQITKKEVWKLSDDILINKTTPSKQEVDNFLICLFQKRDHYLKTLYHFKPTQKLPLEEQKNDLQYLFRLEVISLHEFKQLKEELEKLFD